MLKQVVRAMGENAGNDNRLRVFSDRFNTGFACDDGLVAAKVAMQGHDQIAKGKRSWKGVCSV
jgi:hypothetical protein